MHAYPSIHSLLHLMPLPAQIRQLAHTKSSRCTHAPTGCRAPCSLAALLSPRTVLLGGAGLCLLGRQVEGLSYAAGHLLRDLLRGQQQERLCSFCLLPAGVPVDQENGLGFQ